MKTLFLYQSSLVLHFSVSSIKRKNLIFACSNVTILCRITKHTFVLSKAQNSIKMDKIIKMGSSFQGHFPSHD